jgi:ubiquinone/menaquinone biosynthesis C-methylase UbiE
MKLHPKRLLDLTLQILLSIISLCYWFLGLLIFAVGKLFSLKKKPKVTRYKPSTNNLYVKFIDFVHSHGAWYAYNVMKDYIQPQAKILDIGMGSGYLAKKIQVKKQANITGIDVANLSKVNIANIIFDGVRIPCPDADFDIGILAFVLHHAQDQIALIKEAKRTCKKIIILEDNLISRYGIFLGKAHSQAFNLLYGANTECTYHSPDEWQMIFKELNFNIKVVSHGWKPDCFVYPVKAVMFVLE